MTAGQCVNHTAFVVDRGASRRVVQVHPMTSIKWGRIASDISTVELVAPEAGCTANVSQIEPGRHELVVYRGTSRVWEGPITKAITTGGVLTLAAQDVLRYCAGTVMYAAYDNSGKAGTATAAVKSIDRAKTIITAELGRQWEKLSPPVNVVPNVLTYYSKGDLKTTTNTTAYQRTVYDDLSALASRSSLEFTTVGRSILLMDSEYALSQTPTLTLADIAGEVSLTSYGDQVFARGIVTTDGDEEGQAGTTVMADGVNGFPDPYYGAWEKLVESSADEDATDPDSQTLADLKALAAKAIAGLIPTPLELAVADGATLAATSPLYDPDLLVPGVLVPVQAEFFGQTVSRMQRLAEVTWNETPQGETCEVKIVSTDSVVGEAV